METQKPYVAVSNFMMLSAMKLSGFKLSSEEISNIHSSDGEYKVTLCMYKRNTSNKFEFLVIKLVQNAPKSMLIGVSLQTTLLKLIALPKSQAGSWFRRTLVPGALGRTGEEGNGRKGSGRKGIREGSIVPWLLGDRRHQGWKIGLKKTRFLKTLKTF